MRRGEWEAVSPVLVCLKRPQEDTLVGTEGGGSWVRQSEGTPGWAHDLLVFRDKGNPVRPSGFLDGDIDVAGGTGGGAAGGSLASIVLRGQPSCWWKLRNIRPSRSYG